MRSCKVRLLLGNGSGPAGGPSLVWTRPPTSATAITKVAAKCVFSTSRTAMQVDIDGCTVTGAAHDDLSSQKDYVRLPTMNLRHRQRPLKCSRSDTNLRPCVRLALLVVFHWFVQQVSMVTPLLPGWAGRLPRRQEAGIVLTIPTVYSRP